MSTFFLSVYIALIFIRPMDWYPPVLDFQLVTAAALMTLVSSFPRLLDKVPRFWKAIPEVKAAAFLLLGVTFSFAYPLYIAGMTTAFQDFGKVLIFYLLLVILSQGEGSYRILLWTLLLCTAWMATHGVLMGRAALETGGLARGFGPATPRFRPSLREGAEEGAGVWQTIAYGIFEDPNDLCLVFIIAIPLLLAEYRASKNMILRVVCLSLIPLNLYAAYFTNSRGGLMGVFGMMASYVVGRLKGFKRWFMIVFSVGLVTVGAPSRGSELGIVDKDRLMFWGDGLMSFREYPIFGIGFQNFGLITDGHAAHNTYVNALAELGMLGYIPFMLMLYLTLAHLYRAMSLKDHVSSVDQSYLVGIYSAIIGYLTAVYFLSRTYNHVLYLLLGLGVGKVIASCRDDETFQIVFGPKKRDIRRGLYFAFATIPFIWLTIRLGRMGQK